MRLFIALKRSQDMKYAGGNGKVSVSQPHFMSAYKSSIAAGRLSGGYGARVRGARARGPPPRAPLPAETGREERAER